MNRFVALTQDQLKAVNPEASRMITWETAKMLAGIALAFALIVVVQVASGYTPCDSWFWQEHRRVWKVTDCR